MVAQDLVQPKAGEPAIGEIDLRLARDQRAPGRDRLASAVDANRK
jgi:hypothetical protein